MQKLHNVYYLFKPLLPRSSQLFLRKCRILFKQKQYAEVWPINEKAGATPSGWKGWPENKKFALLLTHDVDTGPGQEKCLKLMQIEKELGFKSTFFFVPEDYPVSHITLHTLRNNGFEVGVHGLNHDGKLYDSWKSFQKKAKKINQYLKDWNAVGFRSPCMQHNLEWLSELNIDYDASTYDIDPFEPQGGGVETIFPFIYKKEKTERTYVELPYTLPQDFLLYILMQKQTIDLWKRKVDWLAHNGGMVHLITHPDYMNFNGSNSQKEEYSINLYINFLSFLKEHYEGQYWIATAKEVAEFWQEEQMNIKKSISNYASDVEVIKVSQVA